MLIQTLIPNIVAVEVTLAAEAGIATGFMDCPFGHVHAAPVLPASTSGRHQDDGSPSDDHSGKGGLSDGCAICIALHTGGQFTTPAEIQVAVPYAPPQGLPETSRQAGLASLVIAAGYNARAPPRGSDDQS